MTVSSYDSYGIDVTDDTRTQAYNGTSAETDATRRAATETSGKVVLYNGAPAQTFFGSSSGGKTADVYSAWGGGEGLDYLQSVDDPYEDPSVSTWSVTYTADEVTQMLADAGVNIGRVTNIVVEERGERTSACAGCALTAQRGRIRSRLRLAARFWGAEPILLYP